MLQTQGTGAARSSVCLARGRSLERTVCEAMGSARLHPRVCTTLDCDAGRPPDRQGRHDVHRAPCIYQGQLYLVVLPLLKTYRKCYAQVARTKSAAAAGAPRSVLRLGDDPSGWAAAIQKDWVIKHLLTIGVKADDGTVVGRPYSVIRPGDFVEVLVNVEFIVRPKKGKRTAEMRLIPVAVTKFADSEEVAVSPAVVTET